MYAKSVLSLVHSFQDIRWLIIMIIALVSDRTTSTVGLRAQFICLLRVLAVLQKDVFELEAVDLLDVKKVIVGHDAVIAGHGWFLDRIIVRVSMPQCSKRYVFPFNR